MYTYAIQGHLLLRWNGTMGNNIAIAHEQLLSQLNAQYVYHIYRSLAYATFSFYIPLRDMPTNFV